MGGGGVACNRRGVVRLSLGGDVWVEEKRKGVQECFCLRIKGWGKGALEGGDEH